MKPFTLTAQNKTFFQGDWIGTGLIFVFIWIKKKGFNNIYIYKNYNITIFINTNGQLGSNAFSHLLFPITIAVKNK